MKYLSFDIEATGLDPHDLIIEYAMIPFCAKTQTMADELKFHTYIQCPSFEDLKPKLNPWVIENNEILIKKAHNEGVALEQFKKELIAYFAREDVKKYFADSSLITLFGKSMNAIDLPFLNRDLGHEFMRKYFSHRTLDLTSVVLAMIDLGHLPPECESGSKLMEHFGMGEVAHTALEDAVNTAKLYFKILSQSSAQ